METLLSKDTIKQRIKDFATGTTIGIIDMDKNVVLFANKFYNYKLCSMIQKTTFTQEELEIYNTMLSAMMQVFAKNCVVNSFTFAKRLSDDTVKTTIDLPKIDLISGTRTNYLYFGANICTYSKDAWEKIFYINGAISNEWEVVDQINLQLQTKNKLLFAKVFKNKILLYTAYTEFQEKNTTNVALLQNLDAINYLFAYCKKISTPENTVIPEIKYGHGVLY